MRIRFVKNKKQLIPVIATGVSTVLVIFLFRELSRQPVLIASLASSLFLLYFQPHNKINDFKPLVLSHILATIVGYTAHYFFPEPYIASSLAVTVTVLLMTMLRIVHPPAVSTSLVFAYRPIDVSNLLTFLLVLLVVTVLAVSYFFVRHLFSDPE